MFIGGDGGRLPLPPSGYGLEYYYVDNNLNRLYIFCYMSFRKRISRANYTFLNSYFAEFWRPTQFNGAHEESWNVIGCTYMSEVCGGPPNLANDITERSVISPCLLSGRGPVLISPTTPQTWRDSPYYFRSLNVSCIVRNIF